MRNFWIIAILLACLLPAAACSKSSDDSSSGDDDTASSDDDTDDDDTSDDDSADDDEELTYEGKCRAIWSDCFPDLKDLAAASCAEYKEGHFSAGECADAALTAYFSCLSSCEFENYPSCAQTAKTSLQSCE